MSPDEPADGGFPPAPDRERQFRRMMAFSAAWVLLAAGFFGGWLYFAAQRAPTRGLGNEWLLLLAAGLCAGLAVVCRVWAGQPVRQTWGPPGALSASKRKRQLLLGGLIVLPWYVGAMYILWPYADESLLPFVLRAAAPFVAGAVVLVVALLVRTVVRKVFFARLRRRAAQLLSEQDLEDGQDGPPTGSEWGRGDEVE